MAALPPVSPPTLAAWCAAITLATEAVTFLPIGMCRNSLGPCALECGPSTPVIMNCAPGNFSPSMPMNGIRSEEHTSELQSLMRISYAVFCLKKKRKYSKVEIYNELQEKHH